MDWLLATFVAVTGLAILAGGSALTYAIDRSVIADVVAEGNLRMDLLSNADTIEVGLATGNWTGLGLIATGAIMVIAAVVYAVVRRNARVAAEEVGKPRSDYAANALLGAVVSALVSFVPFSPAIGGGLAGYLERGESERTVGVGALSGIILMVPLLGLLLFLTIGLLLGLFAFEAGALAIAVGAAMLMAMLVVAVAGAGLGALGGYVGGKLAE
ncbi:MAG: DUF5518 domain-containing protein [Halapricum sp.]